MADLARSTLRFNLEPKSRMYKTLIISLVLIAAVFAASDVIVKDLKLFVDGKEFIIKGMAYNPAPISFLQSTGLCSISQTPYALNDYRSHCFDSDFWDGATYPDRVPPGPANGWFRSLWERDLPDIKSIGVNTLRIYNVNPTNYLASLKYQGQHDIVLPLGKDHRQFLDYCASLGLKVIWPLYSDAQALLYDDDETMKFFMRTAIEEVGNHSAILMYAIGNELNYVGNASVFQMLLTRVNMLMDYARDYQQTYWNRKIPLTTVVDDNPDYYDWQMDFLRVDVFSANAGYRSQPLKNQFDFYNLWSGEQPRFAGFYNLSCYYQKPLLIAEMNPVGYQNPPAGAFYPTGFPQMWRDLIQHVDQGAIGGVFFEYNDELWKASGNQNLLGIVSTAVACIDGKCSNQTDVWIPDAYTKKGWEYDAVCCGSIDGVAYNFRSDPFALLGRPAANLNDNSQPCPASWIRVTTAPPATTTAVAASTSAVQTSSATSTTTSTDSTNTVTSNGDGGSAQNVTTASQNTITSTQSDQTTSPSTETSSASSTTASITHQQTSTVTVLPTLDHKASSSTSLIATASSTTHALLFLLLTLTALYLL